MKRLKRIPGNRYSKAGLKWLDIRIIKNLPSNKINTISFQGSKLTIFGRHEFLHALDEIFIDEIYKLNLEAKTTILDCGANIGLSIIYLKKQTPTARIIAFEPDEKNFTLLEKNMHSFGLTNVEIKKEAVWIDNTMLNFSNNGSMSSKIDPTVKGASVKASRLKDFLHQKVGFLKLDIEGAEYLVLKDIEDELVNVENMFLEYHGKFEQNNELCEILDIVRRQGFKFYIKEASVIHQHPFIHQKHSAVSYDIQLNIFCFRTTF
ncbi:MAG: FkbM family methyltransferase [Segetibacter sp.]